MFEELCRKTGIIRIPLPDTYTEKGNPEYREHPVAYFSMDRDFRDDDGALQLQTQFYCKGWEQRIPSDAQFIDADGNAYEIRNTEFVFDHFNQQFEFNILTVV